MSISKWIAPLFNVSQAMAGVREYRYFIKSWRQYSDMKGAEHLSLEDAYPCLYDRTHATQIDAHYFYQNIWAMRRIKECAVSEHVDVGSLASFVGLLSTIVKVIFIDIRPLEVKLSNFESRSGTLLSLPFANNSVPSISCLHVAEHIGLGRYGDPLDPLGTRKAARELTRVLAAQGHLYFSLPVGQPRVCFNAHRIHSPAQILEYFSGLKLVEFSGVTDLGEFIEDISPATLENASYACGMFHFTKES